MKKYMYKISVACTCFIAILLLCPLFGCTSGANSSGQDQQVAQVSTDSRFYLYDLSEGLSAIVNDVEIGEKPVTAFIENFRSIQGLEDDDDWGTWLIENGYATDDIRDETMNYFINQELIRQVASEQGVSVTESEIDSELDLQKEETGSDDDWQAMLESLGETDEEYRDDVRDMLLTYKLMDVLSDGLEVSDEDLLAYIQSTDDSYASAESLDDIDSSVVDESREAYLDYEKQNAYTKYMMEFKNNSSIIKEGRPDGLSYAIDLAPYEQAYYAQSSTDDDSTPSSEE
jgi:foldase protein PrsA